MEQQTSNFSIVKTKIIKTDELLKNYSDKCTKLQKSHKTIKELKLKYDGVLKEIDRLKLENERLSFNLNDIKPKYEKLEAAEQELKLQLTEVQNKYNSHSVESQLKFQELELKYNPLNQINGKKGRKHSAKKEADLDEKYKDQCLLLAQAEQQNVELENSVRTLNSQIEEYREKEKNILLQNKQLGADLNVVKDKVIILERLLSNQEVAAQNEQEKYANEVNVLNKKIATLIFQKGRIEKLTKENEALKQEIESLLPTKDKKDVWVQTNIFKLVSQGINTEDIEQYVEYDKLPIHNIFDEMKLPSMLSPMNSMSSEENNTSLNNSMVLMQESIEDIPDIIITPPTPNEDSNIKTFSKFESNVVSQDVQTQTICKKLLSTVTQTDTLFKNKKCDVITRNVETQTEENSLERRRQMKLLWKNNQNNIKMKKKQMQRNTNDSNVILKAIKIMSENNLSVTISNNVAPSFAQESFINSFNIPLNVKNEKSTFEKMSCVIESCEMTHYNMKLDDKSNLLGFINIKEEKATPPVSRISNRAEKEELKTNCKKNVNDKKKRKRVFNSEFNSETETEIERCFDKNKKKKIAKKFKSKKYIEKTTESDSDISTISSIKETSDFEENIINKKSSCRKIIFNENLPLKANNFNKRRNRIDSTDSNKSLEEFPNKVLNNVTLRRSSRTCNKRYSTDTSVVNMTPHPKILSPFSNTNKNVTPAKERMKDFNESKFKSLVNDMELPKEMITAEVEEPNDMNAMDYESSEESIKLNEPPIIPVEISDESTVASLQKEDITNDIIALIEPAETDVHKLENITMENRVIKKRLCHARKDSKLMAKTIKCDTSNSVPENKFKSLENNVEFPKEMVTTEVEEPKNIDAMDCEYSEQNMKLNKPLIIPAEISDASLQKEIITNDIITSIEPTEIHVNKLENNIEKQVKKKPGRARKVSKLMAKSMKLAKNQRNIYKEVPLPCDTPNLVPEKIEKNMQLNKKIRIVQNIVISPPQNILPPKNCDTTKSEASSQKVKQKTTPKNEDRFRQHTTSDLTSKIIEEMTKEFVTSKTGTNNFKNDIKPQSIFSPKSVKKNEVKNEVTHESTVNVVKNEVKSEITQEAKDDSKEEKVEEEILECPASPEIVELPDAAPKIIPTVNMSKKFPMAGSKVNTLFDKLLLYSMEEKVLDEVVSEFLNEDVNYIAHLIFDKVSVDINDKANLSSPLAPVLTDTQRVLLGFMARLENKSMPTIFNCFLEKVQNIFFDKHCFSIYGLESVEPITRLYTAVCKLKRNLNRMRRFCVEAFYFMDDFAVPLFFHVLTMWPEVLPLENESQNFPLAKVLVQICFLKSCNKPGYNLMPVRDLLHKFFGYLNERRNSDEVFNEVLTEYFKNPCSRLSILTMLVYCKNQPSKWVHQKLKEHFIPSFHKIKEENVNLKASVLILTSHICNGLSAVNDEAVMNEMVKWYRSLEEDTTDVVLRNAIYYAIKTLPKMLKAGKKKVDKDTEKTETSEIDKEIEIDKIEEKEMCEDKN